MKKVMIFSLLFYSVLSIAASNEEGTQEATIGSCDDAASIASVSTEPKSEFQVITKEHFSWDNHKPLLRSASSPLLLAGRAALVALSSDAQDRKGAGRILRPRNGSNPTVRSVSLASGCRAVTILGSSASNPE